MIIIDTNVISEFMTSPPDPSVLAWMNQQSSISLFTTSITIAEIYFGLRIMPEGKRHHLLREKFEQFITRGFTGRVLNFDSRAAKNYGEIMGDRRESGRPMSTLDGQIAAIACSRGFAVATRNIKDFLDCGIEIVNPFQ